MVGVVNPNRLSVADVEGAKPFTVEVAVGAGVKASNVTDRAWNADAVVALKRLKPL